MKRILRTLRRKLRAARSITWQDWGDLVQAWVMLLLVDIGLRTIPFLRLQRMLEYYSGRIEAEDPRVEIQRIARLVSIASRNHLYSITCLRQALVLWRMLAKKGIVTELKFGVRKGKDHLKAHAWVEWHGKVIGRASNVESFSPLT